VTFLNSQHFCRHNRIVCNDDFYDIQKSHPLREKTRARFDRAPISRSARAVEIGGLAEIEERTRFVKVQDL
jgi:hypothetical protein